MTRETDLMRFETAHRPRPHVNALVRPHHLFTTEQRCTAAIKAGWNVFKFPSKMLMGGDLLSDSGTTTLTVDQDAMMRKADEAYGNNWGYEQLLDRLTETVGIPRDECHIYLFHQCRRVEDVLYSHLRGAPIIVPSNSFFDTTRANAEANNVQALDLPDTSVHEFKGNIDLDALERVLDANHSNVPFVLMTVTNNTGGGQPASLDNMQAARNIAHANRTSFFLDACRFAENAWFIQQHEKAYAGWSITAIVHKMFSLCDGFTISFKKDGLANMGGALLIKKDAPLLVRQKDLVKKLRRIQTRTEGHESYGGISGRDIMAIVEGLPYVVTNQYLDGRIEQVHDFGTYMKELGIPVLEPFGGHAVYIDTDRFFSDTRMRREDFGGIAVCAVLLLKGVRLCELGCFAFGKYDPDTDKEILPERNYIRAALPRGKYERDDLCYVGDCIKAVYDRRFELPCAVPVFDRDEPLRNFTARFELTY
ncbi:tryptophanase [Candidatus Kaiserbacteria bacterium]|nr:tryptophanase [Candidatus Kaiserbacteria bacterium]